MPETREYLLLEEAAVAEARRRLARMPPRVAGLQRTWHVLRFRESRLAQAVRLECGRDEAFLKSLPDDVFDIICFRWMSWGDGSLVAAFGENRSNENPFADWIRSRVPAHEDHYRKAGRGRLESSMRKEDRLIHDLAAVRIPLADRVGLCAATASLMLYDTTKFAFHSNRMARAACMMDLRALRALAEVADMDLATLVARYLVLPFPLPTTMRLYQSWVLSGGGIIRDTPVLIGETEVPQPDFIRQGEALMAMLGCLRRAGPVRRLMLRDGDNRIMRGVLSFLIL